MLVWAHGGSWRSGSVAQWHPALAHPRVGSARRAATGHHRYPSTPADVADLADAAPAALVVGTLDPVVDDVRAYAARLTAAGVPVALHEIPGVRHGAFLGSSEFRRRLAAAYTTTLRAHRLDRSTR